MCKFIVPARSLFFSSSASPDDVILQKFFRSVNGRYSSASRGARSGGSSSWGAVSRWFHERLVSGEEMVCVCVCVIRKPAFEFDFSFGFVFSSPSDASLLVVAHWVCSSL